MHKCEKSSVILFSRQGSDGRWIESLRDQPDRHYYFLWSNHHFQIKTNAGIHVKEFQQLGSHPKHHTDKTPDGQPAGDQASAVEGDV